MRVKTIGFGYVKNLGNYENCKLYMEAELEDWENPSESFDLLRAQVANELNLPDHYRELRRKYSWQLQVLEETNAAVAASEEKLKKVQQNWENFAQSLTAQGINSELVQASLNAETTAPESTEDASENYDPYYDGENDGGDDYPGKDESDDCWAATSPYLVERDAIPTLLDFDSPNLASEIDCIVMKDKQILEEFWPLLEKLTWNEKMAVGQTAYFFIAIAAEEDSLLKLIPVRGDGSFSKPLQQAMELLEELSIEMLAEVATKILEEDIELEAGKALETDDNDCEGYPGSYCDEYGRTFGGGSDTEEHPSYI